MPATKTEIEIWPNSTDFGQFWAGKSQVQVTVQIPLLSIVFDQDHVEKTDPMHRDSAKRW